MNINKFVSLGEALKGIPNAVIRRWTSHDDHEDIVIRDSEHNIYEIKFYPNKDSIKE